MHYINLWAKLYLEKNASKQVPTDSGAERIMGGLKMGKVSLRRFPVALLAREKMKCSHLSMVPKSIHLPQG